MAKGQIRIGTSGWGYKHWKGTFYSEDISDKNFLGYYVKYFDTVEINNSFYRLPEKSTFTKWGNAVPKEFLFSVKGSRYITHIKRLKDSKDPIEKLMERAAGLGEHFGPILFQLPPNFKPNMERLNDFLGNLPKEHRFAIEFRNEEWFGERTEKTLAGAGVAFCIYEIGGRQSTRSVTADFVYVRLHGPEEKYQGNYSYKALDNWAKVCSSWANDSKDVYLYFDNDEKGYAVQNAIKLKELVNKT